MRAPRIVVLSAVTAALVPAGVGLAVAPSHHPGTATRSSAVPHGWAATATRAMDLGLAPTGRLPGSRILRISVGLALRHRPALNRLATAVSTPGSAAYQHFLSPAQVNARFGPRVSTVRQTERWLSWAGFTEVHASSDRLLVRAQAPAAIVERTFHTSLATYRVDGHPVFANTSPALVPATLGGRVIAVLGLSDLPMSTDLKQAGAPDLTGFTPQQIDQIYQASSLPAAKRSAVAVIMMGDPTPTLKNLRIAEAKNHLPRVPVSIHYGGPKAEITQDNPLTGNAEWDLDTQYATQVPHSVKRLYIYDEQTFTDQDVINGINSFVERDVAVTGSASLGECDYIAWADGAMLISDEALEEGASHGQSFFASTGDNGSFCPEVASTGVPGGPPDTSWPATGTWTVAAGGTTTLADDNGNVIKETAWVGGGGGVSPFETGGDWTLDANGTGQVAQFTNQGGRAEPDVSADADPTTPVLVYAGGSTPEGVGGTSVAAPLLSGLYARIQSSGHNRLGLASIRFYGLYNETNPGTVVNGPTGPVHAPAVNPKPVSGFRDIVLGSNGAFTAKPGWDATTGIGVLEAATLAKRLDAHPVHVTHEHHRHL